MDEIKIRIKKLRAKENMNQTDFAKKLNVSQNMITRYENGLTIPPDRVISDICREFNVNEEWLRHGTGDMYRKMTKEEETLQHLEKLLKNEKNQLRKDIIYAIAKLPPEAWDSIENFIYDLTKKKDS